MEYLFLFVVIPLMAFCILAAIFLAFGVNIFKKISQMYAKLTNKNCRAGKHEYKVDLYMFYEYDDAHLHCKHCGHYKYMKRTTSCSAEDFISGMANSILH